ncbi:hypothetical protein BT93_E0914 [Corymbia citriodora subsp. variegata]|nr:hypothetical protein BT93_E0914 [Corymbia citriodora subsp. variegata]
MEGNNNPVANAQGGAPAIEGGDWRQSLTPEIRKRVISSIMENLMKSVPHRGQEGLHERQSIAMQLERKLYTSATSQQDYIKRISLKMLQIERCQQNKGANSLPANTNGTINRPSDPGTWPQIQNQSQSNPNQVAVNQSQAQHAVLSTITTARTQCPPNLSSMPPAGNLNWNSTASAGGPNSNMRHIPVFSDKPQMGMKGRDVSSSMFCNPQRQIHGPEQQLKQQQSQNPQQHVYSPQLQRQAMKQNFHSLSLVTRSQPPQQSVLQTCPITQQIVMQSSPLSSLHQNQLSYTQQSKPPMLQQHQESFVRLQHQTQHTSAFPVPPQQQSIGQQTSVLNMPQNNFIDQHSSLVNMQQQVQNDIANQQQVQQPFVRTQYGCSSKQGAMQEPPNSLPSGSYHSGIQRGLQTSRSSMLHQSMTNQQKQSFPSQMPVPGTSKSLDSFSQTDTACMGDWQEEVFQKINDMKTLYLSELEEIHIRFSTMLQQIGSTPQSPNSGQYQKLQGFQKMVGQLISFLRVPKSKISPSIKDKLSSCEKSILNFINARRSGRLILPQQPQVPPTPPHTQSMPPEQSPAQFSPVLSPGIDMSETTLNLQCNPNMHQFNHLNQHQEWRMLQNQQVQPQLMQKQQISQQLPACLQTYQMSQPHPMGNSNDSKMRLGTGVRPGSISQQPRFSGYRSGHLDQQLKPGTPLPKSSQLPPAASIQIAEHPSPEIDKQKLLMASTKAVTFLQSANSPFMVPSPATPLGSSPMPVDTEKSISGLSSLSNGGNIGQLQTDDALASTPPISTGTPGISISPLLAELSSPDAALWKPAKTSSGKSSVTEQPVERLIRAVKSVSHQALESAVGDIISVVRGNDCLAGTAQGSGSRTAVGEDLPATLKCHLPSQNSNLQDEISGTGKLKRHVNAMPLNLVPSLGSMNDSFAQRTGSEISDIESTASSSIKRPKYEANYDLWGEIKQINQQLILTVVDISDEEVDSHAASAHTKVGEGTIVKCSFTGVGINPNLRSETTSLKMSLIQPLWLLLPMNYPNCSPIVLNKSPVDVSKEAEDLTAKAKSRLSRALRMLPQPTSLGGIALRWEESVRAVVLDFARQSGGGTFSSKYGAWEQCG